MSFRILSIALPVALWVSAALADGKVYWGQRIPPQVPFQRAVILFKDGDETLTIQSRIYAGEGAATNAVLGWVVPVPAVPALAAMEDDTGWQMFHRLAWQSGPRVIRLREIISAVLFVGGLASMAVGLLLLVACSPQSRLWSYRPVFDKMVFLGLLTAGVTFFSPAFLNGRATKGIEGVDVLDARDVGIYETRTIRSDSSDALVEWLTAAGFRFEASDRATFDHYISNNWCFVTAMVRADMSAEARAASLDGLLHPLVLRFKTPVPIYPLALTGTIGTPTEVLLYVLSDKRWQTDRMKLHFAGEIPPLSTFQSPGYGKLPFSGWEMDVKYLCRFRATLAPEAMRKDLVLEPAPNNRTYRERLVKW
jgi:hypothetical protein